MNLSIYLSIDTACKLNVQTFSSDSFPHGKGVINAGLVCYSQSRGVTFCLAIDRVSYHFI